MKAIPAIAALGALCVVRFAAAEPDAGRYANPLMSAGRC